MTILDHIAPDKRVSQAIKHSQVLYLSGQVSDVTGAIDAQCASVFDKVEHLLSEGGSNKSLIIHVTVWLANMVNFDAFNIAWEGWFDGTTPPTRATCEAKLASPDYRIEMIVTAAAM